jgi:hypothetical protein
MEGEVAKWIATRRIRSWRADSSYDENGYARGRKWM